MQTSAQPNGWKTIAWASGRVDATPARNPTPDGAVVILTADHTTTRATIWPLIRINVEHGYMELPAVADAPNQNAAMTALLAICDQIKTETRSRADRIHAIWKRACHKFRDAAYAYGLACTAMDNAKHGTPERRQAFSLIKRAQESMAHWNARSYKLAKAQTSILLGDSRHG